MIVAALIIIFILLTLLVGGYRTSKSLVTVSGNAIVLLLSIGLI